MAEHAIYFELIKDFSGFRSYYGPIPEDPIIDNDFNEYLELRWFMVEDCELFLKYIYDLDNYSGALLDYTDVDEFSGEKLLKLKLWLDKTLPDIDNKEIKELFTFLLSYVERAIELETMVVIQA